MVADRSERPARDEVHEKLRVAREKIRDKNERLQSYREQLERKDRQIEALRAELTAAGGERRLPGLSGAETPVFFLVGRGKSGTTWLQDTLDTHPEILCRGEGRFFERAFKRMVAPEDLRKESLKTVQPTSLHAALSLSDDLRTWIERSVWTDGQDAGPHVGNLNRLAVHYFLSDRLEKAGKKMVGDKTTFSDGRVLEEISSDFPEARVIHAIRDGRDHAVSMVHHAWNNARDAGGFYDLSPEEVRKRDLYRRDPEAALSEGLFTERRLRGIARAWGDQVGRAIETGPALFDERYAEVRYEDLLLQPEAELGRLLDFLGADASEETVKRCVEANTFEKRSEGRAVGEESSSSFYRKGISGDWKNVFTTDDKRIFKRAAGATLLKLGYEENEDW